MIGGGGMASDACVIRIRIGSLGFPGRMVTRRISSDEWSKGTYWYGFIVIERVTGLIVACMLCRIRSGNKGVIRL